MFDLKVKFIEGQFQKITVGADDVIVISYAGQLPQRTCQIIKNEASKVFPGRNILVLEDGMKIGIVCSNPKDTGGIFRRLNKEEIEIEVSRDGKWVLASLFEQDGYRWWDKYKPSELPNDLISLDDLKRFGIEIVNGEAFKRA